MTATIRSRVPAMPPLGLESSAIWLAAIVGLSLSFASLMLVRQQLEAHRMVEFRWVAHNRIRAIAHELDSSLLAVTTLRDHVDASGNAEGEAFRAFAGALQQRFPGARDLMWVPHRPSSPGATSFAVVETVPGGDEGIPAGFNLGSDPRLAEVLSRAHERRQVAASGRVVHPVSHDDGRIGFMVASPVFATGAERLPAGTGPGEVRGFVVGFFQLDELVQSAVSRLQPRGVEILMLDESASPGERFTHFYASRLSPRSVDAGNYGQWQADEEEPKVAQSIQVADRRIRVICGRTGEFRSAEAFQEGPWIALAAGLLFTMLLSLYLVRIRDHERQRFVMQQQLVAREELFRQMTETVDEAFWATSAGGELLYLSPAFRKILGIRDDVDNPSFLDAVHPEDQDALVGALQRTGDDGTETSELHRVRRPDGALRWVRTRGFAIRDPQGRVYRVVGFMEDVTEHKLAQDALRESEAKLRDLFQHSPDIIMTVDVRGKILLMNRSIPALPPERAIGHSSLALLPRDVRKWSRKALKKVFRKGATRHFEFTADDGTHWEGRIVPIRNAEGDVTAAMVVAGDVTEKRRLESQSLHNARLASIGVVAAGVAHEINNPNNAIQFNAGLVSRAWQDVTPILNGYLHENGDFALGGLSYSEARDKLPRLLSEITTNSDRIRRIVQNLKHLSRHDPGDLSGEADLEQVLEAVVMVLHNQIQKCTDAFTLDVPSGLPPVRGNAQQLEQVILNVLLNALQALPDRGRAVQVRAGFEEVDQMLWIAVRDEGSGIAERDLGRLTEPFFTTRTDTGGTGLGLSISRSIVEKHGGSMRFESERGRGTTVTIRLPAVARK